MEGRASNAMLIHHFLVPSTTVRQFQIQSPADLLQKQQNHSKFSQQQKPLSTSVLLVSNIFKLQDYLENPSDIDW